MGRGYGLWQRLAEEADVGTDNIPGQSIVEIAGCQRVLIENHLGVMGYSRERILVKVKFGCVCICGCGLELIRMTREQLVIQGKIDAVTLQRRERI